MSIKSQKFALYDHPSQMEPLLPGEHHVGSLLERAHELQRAAQSLAGVGAPAELRQLLRAMNSYYSNKIEGQHTLPFEIENALRSDYSQEPDKARRQRLALAHMETERAIETGWKGWASGQVWSAQMPCQVDR